MPSNLAQEGKMFFFKKKTKVVAVADGTIHELSAYPDDAISQKMLGDGFFIEPTGELICSPIDGEVAMIFPTAHAAAVQNQDYEILIHMGGYREAWRKRLPGARQAGRQSESR